MADDLLRIYFASDLHASDKCWKKFLRAADFYGADIIIVGGDITGKFVVPIVEDGQGRYAATFAGVPRKIRTTDALTELQRLIRNAGQYPYLTTPEERDHLEANPEGVDALFRRLVLERVEEWVREADSYLAGKPVRCFVSGANDDYLEVDDVLRTSTTICVPEGLVIDLDGFEMVSIGWGNPTPWNCPRDLSEEELAVKIGAATAGLTRPRTAIFNFHVPPIGSHLDVAPRLDEDLRYVLGPSGDPEMIPVGSTAVRDAIEQFQPMLGLHGHIHESRGIARLNSTVCINPGSEYGEGVLDGAIVHLDKSRGIVHTELVAG